MVNALKHDAINVSMADILNGRILIVDDTDANALPLERVLNNSGYRYVSSTDDFHAACEMHRKYKYDLLMLNVQLAGMDQLEVLNGLKQMDSEGHLSLVAIIAQSSNTLYALQVGARDFIRKPFDILEVKTRIHNMLVVRFLYKKMKSYNKILEQAVQERTAELRESEARFRSLIELSSDWYWEQDCNGKFTKISGPALEMLGIEGEICSEAENIAARPRWNKGEREKLISNIASRRPFLDFSYSLTRPDGSHQYLQVSGEPMFDASGRFSGYRGVGIDVSERIRPEKNV